MALKQRLSTLRRQAGAQRDTEAGTCAPGTQIAERVRRLRPAVPASAPATRQGACGSGAPGDAARRDARLAERLDGEVLAPGVILIEHRVALEGRHGARALRTLDDSPSDLPEAAGRSESEWIFVDTETTGLSGGSGTTVFMLGLARVQDNALVVRQYVLSAFAGEAAMLAAAGDWLGGRAVLVSYNGKSFDVPLLAARCRLAGIADPFSRRDHLDLLHPTRRAFARIWDDCRLSTVERRLLDFRRLNDLPGSEAPAAWLAFVQRGNDRLLPEVARHNHWDLVSLAALLPALAEVHADPGAWGADVAGVARAHRQRGDEERARALLGAHRDRLDDAGLRELARLQRRAGAWSEACALWEELASRGCVESRMHLAKYHEHVRRDPRAALAYCTDTSCDAALQRRRRLQDKLQRRSGQRDWFD
ncbi:MAG TPA: ribonuclease H-like domain-containing protein [Gammaproteobacteria bacterium]|nr:ribonuclease H-like domain-containing protein [Gammaproteobacteria bacterium]